MAKHENIIVDGSVILNQWNNDNMSASEHAGFEIMPHKNYEVCWPDHVITPKFNCDCTILREIN